MEQELLNLASGDDGDELDLASYAQRAYLEYALSVVKGRALPDATDGQKPVQRRILYSMSRMGLGFTGTSGARPVKSARVVGDVLGRFHPHGDQAAYDALVRMAQDFAQRYPLIDGHGNFGSRDGDGAAAMRYTEARLAKIANLLLDELDEGTVDFVPNYDGSTQEPRQVPARWKIEELARAQWQLVVTELPPGVSSQKVLEEIEELTNPKVKAGKKALLQDQVQLKQTVLSVLDTVRDESSKDAPVRLVFE